MSVGCSNRSLAVPDDVPLRLPYVFSRSNTLAHSRPFLTFIYLVLYICSFSSLIYIIYMVLSICPGCFVYLRTRQSHCWCWKKREPLVIQDKMYIIQGNMNKVTCKWLVLVLRETIWGVHVWLAIGVVGVGVGVMKVSGGLVMVNGCIWGLIEGNGGVCKSGLGQIWCGTVRLLFIRVDGAGSTGMGRLKIW